VKKTKQKCHICDHVTKTPADQTPASYCENCEADLLNPSQETKKLYTVVTKEAGGVRGDLVKVYLTDQRLMFISDGVSSSFVGGGLIGAVVESAVDAIRKPKQIETYASVLRSEINAVKDEVAGRLKNKTALTVSTKDGETYTMTLSKKEGAQFKTELSRSLT